MPHFHTCSNPKCGQAFECDGSMVPREDADGHARPMCAAYYVHRMDLCEACDARLHSDREAVA